MNRTLSAVCAVLLASALAACGGATKSEDTTPHASPPADQATAAPTPGGAKAPAPTAPTMGGNPCSSGTGK